MKQQPINYTDKEFLQKLKDLLEEYHATIDFTCSPGSDTHGISNASVIVSVNVGGFNYKEIARSDEWHLGPDHL